MTASATTAPSPARCPFEHRQTGPTGCPVSAGAAAFDPFSDGTRTGTPDPHVDTAKLKVLDAFGAGGAPDSPSTGVI